VSDVELSQRDIVGMLTVYAQFRDEEKCAAAAKEQIGKLIKTYLAAHPEEAIVDHEHGLQARMQSRNTTESYDVSRMDSELLFRLQESHALNVDVKVIRALEGRDIIAEDVKPYRVPGGTLAALVVEAYK
jgi:hypothetical protein